MDRQVDGVKNLAAASFLCLALSAAAHAAVIYVDAGATGANTGASWTDAYRDLQDALAVANPSTSDEIWVAEGTYRPTSGTDSTISFALVVDVAVYGGFAGTEGLRDERDWMAHETILSGDIRMLGMDFDNSDNVVTGASNATLDGFTVTGGYGGVGMYNDNITGMTVANCTFSGNSGSGGMFNMDVFGLTVADCTFSGNSADIGGGMMNDNSLVTVTNCTFSGNSASLDGGGMYNMGCLVVTVTNCTFSGNSAGFGGGGINNMYSSVFTVTNCTFSGNSADRGGGMLTQYDASVANTVFWGNSAPTDPQINYDPYCSVSCSDVQGGYAGTGNINIDPLFVDADGADNVAGTSDDNLHLQAGSPCIDAGSGDMAPATDIECNARWDDPGMDDVGLGTPTFVDMGAYEFQGTSPANISIITPAGTEVWTAGSLGTIVWRTGPALPSVRIELSRDGGTTWEYIDTGAPVPNTASFNWRVTGPGSTNCVVRVSDAADGTPVGTSDSPFTIEESFTDIGAGLTGVFDCALAWGDYDNDGDLDLALAGATEDSSPYNPVSKVYLNDAGTFTDIGAALTGVWSATLAWGDYDNDGDLDLALAGLDASDNSVSKVYSNDAGTFTDIGAGLWGVDGCSLAWGDYDNDGDLDLALAGWSSGVGGSFSMVYRNEGGTFTDIGAALTGVFDGSLAWGDYDNDGDLDLALAGSSFRGRVSKVYRNDGGTFTDVDAGLTGVDGCALAWGDYDNDGDLDLALAGNAGWPDYEISKVYRNDGGTFTDIGAGLTGVDGCALAWGDHDSDGDLDLALAGWSSSGYISMIYRNDGGTFTDFGATLSGVHLCALAWGDYDNDGDLDLALAGYSSGGDVSKIYRNDGGVFNTPPSAPTGLSTAVSGAGPFDVTFSWTASTDTETPQAGLTYNLRVGTTPGGDEIMSGMAITTPGARLIPAMGDVQHSTGWTVEGLQAGIYYWSVQAIDTAFAGSAFTGSAWAPAPPAQTLTVSWPPASSDDNGCAATGGGAGPLALLLPLGMLVLLKRRRGTAQA